MPVWDEFTLPGKGMSHKYLHGKCDYLNVVNGITSGPIEFPIITPFPLQLEPDNSPAAVILHTLEAFPFGRLGAEPWVSHLVLPSHTQ